MVLKSSMNKEQMVKRVIKIWKGMLSSISCILLKIKVLYLKKESFFDSVKGSLGSRSLGISSGVRAEVGSRSDLFYKRIRLLLLKGNES
jgi:hypothetical protein